MLPDAYGFQACFEKGSYCELIIESEKLIRRN